MKIKILLFLSIPILFIGCGRSFPTDKPVVEGYIEVTGGRVWYKIVGADQPGTPILVIHGGPGIPHDYLEPLEALANERPVIFYDQLGCGNSDRPADTSLWRLDRFTEELIAVRKELGLKSIHILGQSWGSMLTVEYMIRHKPAGIRSLIFSGPCMSTQQWIKDQQNYCKALPDSLQQAIKQAELTGNYETPGYIAALNLFYSLHVCRMDPWPDCLLRASEKMNLEVYKHMWGPSEFTCTGNLRNFDHVSNLPKLKVPILWTSGEFDEATPESTRSFHELTPGSELRIFLGASHSHHLEQEEEYIRAVRDFISTR